MRREHFERWRPVCVACRAAGRPGKPLELTRVMREEPGEVIEGLLQCPDAICLREYPIIDGIPILVADIRGYVANQLAQIQARSDLSPEMDSLLGDCAGPDSAFDTARYYQAIYGRGHWGDLDPDDPNRREGSLAGLFEDGMSMLDEAASGSWLDIGCSVGRTTFELAARTGQLSLGVDLNFAMLRAARQTMRTGRVEHPIRRVGMVYERRSFDVELAAPDKVDFWCCDATGLALPDDAFDGALSMNLVDCVASPLGHLIEMGRVLRAGSPAVIATPYDWAASATPLEAWLGGHSQRSEHRGSSAEVMRQLLSSSAGGEMMPALELVSEAEGATWRVRVHERAEMTYRPHLLMCRGRG